jgi:hypothetical protein
MTRQDSNKEDRTREIRTNRTAKKETIDKDAMETKAVWDLKQKILKSYTAVLGTLDGKKDHLFSQQQQ